MRYKLLGRSGLRVAELCLGTMAFGEDWGWGATKEESARILDAYAEAGGNFIDTADKYTEGTSERYVGELIAPDRDRWVVATKYTLARDITDPNGAGNHRKSLVTALDRSLERLATDYVDLLWVHVWDTLTPIDEVMRALDDQVRAGKVLYVGISDAPAWLIARANTLAELHGWTPFVAAQLQYSLVERTIERDLVPMAQALDLAVTAWGPLGSGVLTGKYRPGAQPTTQDGRLGHESARAAGFYSERNLEIAAAVREVADELGATPAQVALAWLRTRPGVVIPIVGARHERQIRDNLGCLDVELGEEHVARLDAVSAVDVGFPQAFIEGLKDDAFIFGEAFRRIDDHRATRAASARATARR
jgi:aryl-alcohol dehydrogenase-like predicted oxidoreductase